MLTAHTRVSTPTHTCTCTHAVHEHCVSACMCLCDCTCGHARELTLGAVLPGSPPRGRGFSRETCLSSLCPRAPTPASFPFFWNNL